jgi:hypothetical protein
MSGSYFPGGVGTTRLFARYLGHQTVSVPNLDVAVLAVVASILTGGFVVLRLEDVPHDAGGRGHEAVGRPGSTSVIAEPQSPFNASSSSLMKRLRRSRVVSSNGCAAILRACARRRSSSCRLVVSFSMPGNAAQLFQVSSVLRELYLPLGEHYVRPDVGFPIPI